MKSFHSEPCLKAAVIDRLKEHQRLDQIIQRIYWDGTRGCAIGCVLHSGDHLAYETQLGLPVFLAYMDEYIFERLPIQEAKSWPLRFIEAVPVGVDLDLVFPRFMHWLLSAPDGMRKHANGATLPIIDTLVTLYARRIEGIPFDVHAAWSAADAAWSAARSAADAADAAWGAADAARGAADVAWGAARSAADAADAAWGAARSAADAADAARGGAWGAADVAWGAARSAGNEAWSAAIHRQADYLIALLQSYESTPNLDLVPCEERDWIPVRA
jgi:hypothetical protein